MAHMRDTDKTWALGMRDAGVKQNGVAWRFGVSTKTIRRLENGAKRLKPGEVFRRNPGTGPQRKYGTEEVRIIQKTEDAQPGITATQLNLRMPKVLGHLARRTGSNIVRIDLNMRSCVRAEKPYLTKKKKTERMTFARGHWFWSKSKWGNFLYADEKFFWTKNDTSIGCQST